MKNRSIMDAIDWLEEKFLVYTFFATIALISAQIFMRAALNSSLVWSEELARYLFIWQCWVGVSFAERKTGQIKIEFLREVLSPEKKRWLDIVAITITMGTAILLIIFGLDLCSNFMRSGIKSASLRIPMYLIYASMPVGCLLHTIRNARKLIGLFQLREVS